MSVPIEKREQKGKAIVINDDTVHSADVNGNGDARVAYMGPVKRQKSAPNRSLNGRKNRIGKGRGVRVEGTTKVDLAVEGAHRFTFLGS